MSGLDTFRRRKAELRASGMSVVEAHQAAMDEATQALHDREQALLDQAERSAR